MSQFYFYIDIELNFILKFKSRLHLNCLAYLHHLIINFYYFVNYFIFIFICYYYVILYFYFYFIFFFLFLFSLLSLSLSRHPTHSTYSPYPFPSPTCLSHSPHPPPTSFPFLLLFFLLTFSSFKLTPAPKKETHGRCPLEGHHLSPFLYFFYWIFFVFFLSFFIYLFLSLKTDFPVSISSPLCTHTHVTFYHHCHHC